MLFFFFNVEFRRPGLGKQLPTVSNSTPATASILFRQGDRYRQRAAVSMSSTQKLSLKYIKESYLLNANDIKKLAKPYQHDDVVNCN